jgi:hypothetical protein
VAGTADWHGTVTRVGEFPVRMAVEDSAGARSELMLTFVFRPVPTAALTLVMDPSTMPVGYLGQRFAGLRVRVQGGQARIRSPAPTFWLAEFARLQGRPCGWNRRLAWHGDAHRRVSGPDGGGRLHWRA